MAASGVCAMGQAGSGVKITPSSAQDSLKSNEYPYLLPFLGARAQARGFLLPYPSGIMLNVFTGTQDIDVTGLQVGFNGSQMYDLDGIVEFKNCEAHIQNVNLRADLYVLPFLNVYGLAGRTWTATDITLVEPVQFSAQAKFNGNLLGVGATLASGVNNFFSALDFNSTWSYFEKISGTVSAQNISLRVGYTVQLKREQNISMWVASGRMFINHSTNGTIDLGDIAPELTGSKLEPIINSTKADYPDMTMAKYTVMKEAAQTVYDNLPEINDDIDNTVVSYSLKKRPTHKFSGSIGMQYQLSRHYLFRAEAGLLGGRTSLLLSANYRFGIK